MRPVHPLHQQIRLQAGPAGHVGQRDLAAHKPGLFQPVGLVGDMQAAVLHGKVFHPHHGGAVVQLVKVGEVPGVQAAVGAPMLREDAAAGDDLHIDPAALHIRLDGRHAAHPGQLHGFVQAGQQIGVHLPLQPVRPCACPGGKRQLAGGKRGHQAGQGGGHLQAVLRLVGQVKQLVPLPYSIRHGRRHITAQGAGVAQVQQFHDCPSQCVPDVHQAPLRFQITSVA